MSMSQELQKTLFYLLLGVCSLPVGANNDSNALKVDWQKVRAWNDFADTLYSLHVQQMQDHEIRTTSRTGGYPDFPDYYQETTYINEGNGKVLSRVSRIRAQPELVHVIEVNVYDDKHQLERDYLAAYLPYGRNAPIQTLINLHGYNDQLHAFRQFDASGERIYEQCRDVKTDSILISLEYDELLDGPARNSKVLQSTLYNHCFAGIPYGLDESLRPASLLKQSAQAFVQTDDDQIYAQIQEYSKVLATDPRNAQLLLKRAEMYFQVHEFDLAVEDYTDALRQDDTLDQAYFGRGMALGRSGRIQQGIDDLSIYIERNPQNSLAHTKRGVRYLWLGEEAKAKQDFERAIALNPRNAEAHDDLGVIYARNEQYELAIAHFTHTTEYDPSYAKGWHNLALVNLITGHLQPSLAAVNKALALTPAARDTILLKAQIFEALGRTQEARRLAEEAEFLPEGNWSESLSIN